MANVTEKKPPVISIRPTREDDQIVSALNRKLGVDKSQIFRLAIRVLAEKEGVSA
jgi:hypothetical protein